MPSSSSFGATPIIAAIGALNCLSRCSGLEFFTHNTCVAWFAIFLLKLSDDEPPTLFRFPIRSPGLLADTTLGSASAAGSIFGWDAFGEAVLSAFFMRRASRIQEPASIARGLSLSCPLLTALL